MSERERGLLGDLPKSRPSVETPQRAAARRRRATEADPAPEPVADPAPVQGSGLERLARAGFGLAGGTAAAGLRLAERTVNEIGKAVVRR